MPNINSKRFNNPICKECIESSFRKYGKFECNCSGITVEQDVAFAIKNGLSEAEARWMYDPVYFFETIYGNKARWYQPRILLCSSKNLVGRQCRQTGKTLMFMYKIFHYIQTNKDKTVLVITPQESQIKKIWDEYIFRDFVYKNERVKASVTGKSMSPFYQINFDNGSKIVLMIAGPGARGCLPAGEKVLLADGNYINIEDVKLNDKIISFNEHTKKNNIDTVSGLWDNGIQDIYKLITESGSQIRATGNHPIYTIDGFKELEVLKTGDFIAIEKKIPFGNYKLSYEEAAFMGYMIGDGDYGTSGKSLTLRFSNTNKKCINDLKMICRNTETKFKEYEDSRSNGLYSINMQGHKDKFPYITSSRYEIYGKYSFQKRISNNIINADKESLKIFITRLYSTDGWASTTRHYDKRRNKENLQLEIGYSSTSLSLIQDLKLILLKFGIHSRVDKGRLRLNKDTDKIKQKRVSYQLKIRDKHNIELFLNNIGYIYGKEEQCQLLEKNLSLLKDTSIFYFPINKLIKDEAKRLNKSLQSRWAHKNIAWDGKGNIGLEVLKKINAYLQSDILQKLIDGDIYFEKVKNVILEDKEETYNLSIKKHQTFIVGNIVTHNTTADWIYMDEAAIIAAETLNSILMTIASRGDNATVLMTSTPMGRGNAFYNACKADPEFNEYHVSVDDVEEMKGQRARFLKMLGETGFIQECLAEFPDTSGGPFNLKGVDLAQADYEYEDCVHEPGWMYFGGVDWNGANVGTYFYMVGFNADLQLFKAVDKRVIASATWNSIAAKQTFIDLNRKWKPLHWMCDSGYGHTIIEELKHWSTFQLPANLPGNHPDVMIKEIIQAVEFGKWLVMADPFTAGEVKKTTKALIVNQVSRLFEPKEGKSVNIAISKHDTELVKSLENYKLLAITEGGAEKYGFDKKDGIEDHAVDAFMLAVYGVVQNFGELFKRVFMNSVSIDARAILTPNKDTGHELIVPHGSSIVLLTDNSPEPIYLDESAFKDPREDNTGYIARTFNKSMTPSRGTMNSVMQKRNSHIIRRTVNIL